MISRADARRAGRKRYFTGKPCLRGHVAERFVSIQKCCACAVEQKARWYAANPETVKAMNAKPRKFDKMKARRRQAKWRAANKDQANAASARWSRANKHVVNATTRRRQAAKARAVPSWLTQADHAEMEGQYHFAALMSRVSGQPYEVHHEIPLQSRNACGLHVPTNLRTVTQHENRSQSNRFDAAEFDAHTPVLPLKVLIQEAERLAG